MDPQTPWKLVYQDNTAMVFMRTPPPGVPLLFEPPLEPRVLRQHQFYPATGANVPAR